MISRAVYFFRHCMIMAMSNWKRLALSVLGVVFCVYLFQVGMVLINSYNYSINSEYMNFDKNSVLLKGDIPDVALATIKINVPGASVTRYTNNITILLGSSKNEQLLYFANLIGISSDLTRIPIPSARSANNIYKTTIVSGRDINTSDLTNRHKVIVISELAQNILFGNRSAVGEKVKLTLNGNDLDYIEVKVIGVYKNTTDETGMIRQINQLAANEPPINLIVNLYVPETLIGENISAEKYTQAAVITWPANDNDNHQLINMIMQPYQSSVQVYSFNSHMFRLNQINTSMQGILSLATVALIIISGITLMNSLLFLIKERIGEIGIKKSLGASSEMIIMQFFIEVICICIVGAAIGTMLALISVNNIKPFLEDVMATNVVLIYSFRIVLASFLLALIEGVVFSIIPVIHASNIKIVEALNQD